MADIKRLNYFTGQFLDAQDFRDEQTYHKEMRWRGNRTLNGPGVANGLDVLVTPDKLGITVAPGLAFDDQGREIVVLPPAAGAQPHVEILPGGLTSPVNVVISYAEALTDSHSIGGYTGATRVTEAPSITFTTGPAGASDIVLATLTLAANGTIQASDASTRTGSPIWLEPGHTILGKGRLHISGPELLYLLNRDGVIIGKEWGGNGNLTAEGTVSAAAVVSASRVSANLAAPEGGSLSIQNSSKTGATTNNWVLWNMTGTYGNGLSFWRYFADGTNPGPAMWLDDSGAIGIGTTAPKAKLQVSGGAIMPEAGNSEAAGLLFPKDPGGGAGDAAWMRYYARTGEDTTLEIGTSNDAQDHIALMPSGNVGVGTTNPTHKFHVVANGAVGLLESTSTTSFLRLSTSEGLNNRVEITNRQGGTLTLWTAGGGDVLNITRAGNVGIGTAAPAPQAKLQIAGGALMPAAGNAETAGILFPKDPGGGAGDAGWMRYYARAGENTTLEIGTSNDAQDHIALMPSGSVGIGILEPQAKLHVSGFISLDGAANPAATTAFKNQLTPKNFVKAWAVIRTNGNAGAPQDILDGFNIQQVIANSAPPMLTISLAQPLSTGIPCIAGSAYEPFPAALKFNYNSNGTIDVTGVYFDLSNTSGNVTPVKPILWNNPNHYLSFMILGTQ